MSPRRRKNIRLYITKLRSAERNIYTRDEAQSPVVWNKSNHLQSCSPSCAQGRESAIPSRQTKVGLCEYPNGRKRGRLAGHPLSILLHFTTVCIYPRYAHTAPEHNSKLDFDLRYAFRRILVRDPTPIARNRIYVASGLSIESNTGSEHDSQKGPESTR